MIIVVSSQRSGILPRDRRRRTEDNVGTALPSILVEGVVRPRGDNCLHCVISANDQINPGVQHSPMGLRDQSVMGARVASLPRPSYVVSRSLSWASIARGTRGFPPLAVYRHRMMTADHLDLCLVTRDIQQAFQSLINRDKRRNRAHRSGDD